MMKKILLVPDSFKGTMGSIEVCSIMERVIHRFFPNVEVVNIPVADGGEGSVDCFLNALGGELVSVRVHGPFMDEIDGFYGVLPDGTAVVEMAAAAGLSLVGDELDPEKTTTFGVGELVAHALKNGHRKIIVGLGGSATNDGACGMASALGVKFKDSTGKTFIPVGETLNQISKIDLSTRLPELNEAKITAMCDIDNPLYGKNGAAYVFAPQKGADEAAVERLDGNLKHLARVVESEIGIAIDEIPGSGAAGGMGGGILAFLGAQLVMGIEIILDTTHFNDLLKSADLVFSGEGRIDSQSLRGKVISGVAHRTKVADVPLIAVVGDVGKGAEKAYGIGVSSIFSINNVAIPFSEARKRSKEDLESTMENIMRFAQVLMR
jgi:glycerate kinase